MIHQPVQIEQALIYDILVQAALILKNNRAVILIDTDAVHPTTCYLPLRAKEVNTKKRVHIPLDKLLDVSLQRHGSRLQLLNR